LICFGPVKPGEAVRPQGNPKKSKKNRFVFGQKSKVSSRFFYVLYFLLPGFIFDQKIEFLSELNMRSAKIACFLVIVYFIFFKSLKNVKNDKQSFDRMFQFTLLFGPMIDF